MVNSLIEEDYFKRLVCFQRLSDMSEADIDIFCDPERAHLKEGLVTSEEDHGIHFNLRCSTTCVAVLYGRQLPHDELLKVSQTALEDILGKESLLPPALNGLSPLPAPIASGSGVAKRDLLSHDEVSSSPLKRPRLCGSSEDGSGYNGGVDDACLVGEDSPGSSVRANGKRSAGGVAEDEEETSVSADGLELSAGLGTADLLTSSLGPYPSDDQLEYLEDGFQVVAVMVRANAARLKDDMKKEGTRMNTWDMGEVKGGRRELQAKYILLEKRMERRIEATRTVACAAEEQADGNCGSVSTMFDSGSGSTGRLHRPMSLGAVSPLGQSSLHKLPRLEILAARLGLDSFEKKLVLLLIGKTVSPVVKALIDTLEQGSGEC